MKTQMKCFMSHLLSIHYNIVQIRNNYWIMFIIFYDFNRNNQPVISLPVFTQWKASFHIKSVFLFSFFLFCFFLQVYMEAHFCQQEKRWNIRNDENKNSSFCTILSLCHFELKKLPQVVVHRTCRSDFVYAKWSREYHVLHLLWEENTFRTGVLEGFLGSLKGVPKSLRGF